MANTIQDQLAKEIPEVIKKNPFLLPNGEPRYWRLIYRYGNVTSQEKIFRFDGTMNEAILRARKHCEIMKIKYIHLLPAFVDLDIQEGKFMDKLARGENQEGDLR